VCKDDDHQLAELKQQKIKKADITFAAHCHNVNVLTSNISLFAFCCFSSVETLRNLCPVEKLFGMRMAGLCQFY